MPSRIGSQDGLRKKSSSTMKSESMPWCWPASRIQRTTAWGSRARIVRPMTFFTLQYEQVNGQPREVSTVVMLGEAKRRREGSFMAGEGGDWRGGLGRST